MAEPKIVAAAGATSPLGRGHRGNLIERAMGSAVEEASKEARSIWESKEISQEEKQKRITAIMNSDAIRERKLAARLKAKSQASAEATEASKSK
jgi:hypothetical protein